MKTSSGKVINRKFTADSGPANITGSIATTMITNTIRILNIIIRNLNFNVNSPDRIIKERSCYVNLTNTGRFAFSGSAVNPALITEI